MIKLIWDERFRRDLKKYLGKHPEMEIKIKEKLKTFIENPYAPDL